MRLRIPTFLGTFPRTSPRLLKETAAQVAVNTDLRRGSLRPFKALKPVATPGKATAKTIYLFSDTWWFSWDSDVNVVKGPVAGDTLERTYWTGDGAYPKMTTSAIATAGSDYPAASYRLGIPKPASTLICSVTGSAAETDASLKETRFYVYTYVSALGEEGPPSTPSAAIDWMPGQGVALSGFSTAPTGAYSIATKRIYRTNAGTGSAAYQFVAEIPVSQTAYADAVPSANLAEVLPSETWVAPPEGLKGLCVLPNGVLAGFTANEICFSEPFQPHAWPVGYRLTTDKNVVGIGNFDTTVVVATEGVPYLIHGTDPQGLSMQALNINQACVSKRSVVNMGDAGVAYASADGLVLVGPGGAQLVTEAIINPDQWQAIGPASIHGYQVDSRYFGFYAAPGGARGGFIFDVRRPEDGVVWTDVYADGGYPAPKAASIFLLVGGKIVEWDAGSGSLTQTWRSRQAVIGQPVNFGFCQVEASGYSALVARIYAGGVLRYTRSVSSRDPFRLPGGFLSTVWEVEIEGAEEVHEVNLATSAAELAT